MGSRQMIQQGQLLESQRRQRDTSILAHRGFYPKIVFDSASTDVPAFLSFFFFFGDTGEIQLAEQLYMWWKIPALLKNIS